MKTCLLTLLHIFGKELVNNNFVMLANDAQICFICFGIKNIMSYERVSFHPNDNTASVTFNPENIIKIMEKYNKNYMFLEVEE